MRDAINWGKRATATISFAILRFPHLRMVTMLIPEMEIPLIPPFPHTSIVCNPSVIAGYVVNLAALVINPIAIAIYFAPFIISNRSDFPVPIVRATE